MSSARAILEKWIEELGAPGLIAILILFGTIAFAGMVVIPDYIDLNRARNEVRHRSMQKNIKVAPPRVTDSQVRAERLIDELYQRTPPRSSLAEGLEKLFLSARAHHLEIEQAQYQDHNTDGMAFAQHVVDLPVVGRYNNVRAFIAETLAENSTTALESASFERESISDERIRANLKLVIFLSRARQ